ncbi:type II toxin-antitoxin system VapC family toxin [Marihabitans asiaticum]|uniref:Ribonuclease VapC n=1 Tax=Marihabitans asiaticum TaxID=415218 RepID=A0A560WE33_9MICO|nr:type II toxin-antitoxin system VapC family toxin [Marihabitans asiaticum]TWD15917.1 hypothetical protein FB557_1455 [Marihabitans asiaticum]
MILVDTNVVSEFMRPTPDAVVSAWAEAKGVGELALSVITVQEIKYGIRRLPASARRAGLEEAWSTVMAAHSHVVVDYDREAAVSTAEVLVGSASSGHPMTLADAQIAGTCLARGLTLATRNTKDFDHLPSLDMVNPFGFARG